MVDSGHSVNMASVHQAIKGRDQKSGSDVGVRERKVSWNRLRPLVSAAICGLASAPLPWVPVAQR